jgi:hypothetical protein
MNISPEEAQEALAAIELTKAKTRKGQGYAGYYLMIWGAVWFIGFLVSQFMQSNTAVVGWTWGGLVLAAWIASAVLGINQARYVRSQTGQQIGFFYLALLAFAIFWFILLAPHSTEQGVMFFVSLIMFGGVIAGIFYRNVGIVVGSLFATVLAIAGYYLLPGYFYLWEAIFGGLAMLVPGVALRLRWR